MSREWQPPRVVQRTFREKKNARCSRTLEAMHRVARNTCELFSNELTALAKGRPFVCRRPLIVSRRAISIRHYMGRLWLSPRPCLSYGVHTDPTLWEQHDRRRRSRTMRDYQEVSTMDSGDSPRGGTKHFRNKFFDAHAPIYMTNNFTRGTLWEVDFLVEELALRPGARILDVGCGTGRHLIELARRGYRVTNVDLSGGMLRQAMASAASLDQRPDWVRANATRFSLRPVHDAAICICEGSLGLLATAKIRSNTIQRFSRTSTAR